MDNFRARPMPASWWKYAIGHVKFCHKCAGNLRTIYLRAERAHRLVCEECKFVAYQNPHIVVAVVPTRGEKIYLLRRDIEPARGKWTIPGGYMELGETVEQAAVRETREEIRAKVRLTGMQGVYSYKNAGVVTVVFRGEVYGPAPRAGHETQSVKAFHPHDIPWKDLAFRSTFQALRDWVRGN
jgi:ADP-ribose pyrophosphatase YjhB (NUDIX family)